MHESETIEIPISKLKTLLLFVACLGFVTAGIFFVLTPEYFLSPIVRNPKAIFVGGCLAIVVFGFFGVTIFKKLFDEAPGLIISEDGITDNSGGLPAGFVPWSDIIAVKELVVVNQRFINLVVKNPQEYIQRQKSALKRKIMQKNFEIYGAAIGVSANALKINYMELKKIIEKRFSDFKAKRR
jgi:hypothetical protein